MKFDIGQVVQKVGKRKRYVVVGRRVYRVDDVEVYDAVALSGSLNGCTIRGMGRDGLVISELQCRRATGANAAGLARQAAMMLRAGGRMVDREITQMNT